MATIAVTNINDGDAVTAASVNNQINTIVNDYNGNITAANLASNAVTTAKITNATVTADKLATGATNATTAAQEGTASTSYVDLATTTDTVTVTIGANGLALVSIYALLFNSSNNSACYASFAISGATTQAAADTLAIEATTVTGNGTLAAYGAPFLLTGLAVGSTTFKMKYRAGAGTANFANRRIAVVPL